MDAHAIEEGRLRWQARYDAARKRDADFTTLSGDPVEPVYGPRPGDEYEGFERIGWPGEYPFTRGLYPTGYRGRTWTIRQFAGFGNAEQTNERYKMILRNGGGGLSVAFDMPTLMGRDSDDPRSLGEVGHCGVAIDSAADMEVLFKDIPLGDVTTSMTISGPAVPVFCMYLVAAERQASTHPCSTARCRPTSSRSTSPRRSGSSSPSPTSGSSATSWSTARPASPPTSRSPSPATTSARRARRPRRSWRTRSPTASDTWSWASAAGSTWTSSRPASPSSSTRTSTSSRRSPSSARPAGSGPAGCATCTARGPTRPSGCGSTPRPPESRSPRSSRTTTSYAPRWRRWRPCSAAPTPCTPTRSTRPSPCPASRPPRSPCAPSRC